MVGRKFPDLDKSQIFRMCKRLTRAWHQIHVEKVSDTFYSL